MELTVWHVLFYGFLTALATGLGALPFIFIKQLPRHWLGIGDSAAAGLMLAASFNLIHEGLNYSMPRVVLGIILGLAMIVVSRHYLSDHDKEIQVGQLRGGGALKALMIVGVMTAHSFAEGVGVGVAFGDGREFGLFITLAIAIHNIPEGLAISLVLVPRGVSWWKAAGWSIFSSLPQPLMAVLAFGFVLLFRPVLPVGLGFAAGAMIWMVFSELITDAMEDTDKRTIATSVTVAVACMVIFQALVAA